MASSKKVNRLSWLLAFAGLACLCSLPVPLCLADNLEMQASHDSESTSQTKGASGDSLLVQGQKQTEVGPNSKNDVKETDSSRNSVQVFLPPLLQKNKPAWGSIYDANGGTLVQQKLLINHTEYTSDDYGSFSFTVPSVCETLIVAVPDEQGKSIWEQTYFTTPGGLLVSDKSAAGIVDLLDAITVCAGNEPVISHAPSVVEPMQTFVVIGKNFSGKQGDDDIDIDNRSADMLGASPLSIVAVSHQFIKVGPIKELTISRKDMSSLPTEVDVSRAQLKVEPVANGKTKLRINITGSTLPVVVCLTNQALQSGKGNIHFGGWRLGTQNIFLSPGGMHNNFSVEIDKNLPVEAVSAHIVSNGIFDPYTLRANKNFLPKTVADAEERSEIIRLKKRETGLEMQQSAVAHEKAAISKAKNLTPAEVQRLESHSDSLSARLFRVRKMLQARRAVLEGSGESDFEKLVDAASNGSVSSLESVIATKDLGFTEARLLKVVGRKSEEHPAQMSYSAYIPQYKTPPASVLQSYRKRFGRKGYVPPPPDTMALVPPPAPYRPDPNDLGPFLINTPGVLKKPTSVLKKPASSLTQSVQQSKAGSKVVNSKTRKKAGGKASSTPVLTKTGLPKQRQRSASVIKNQTRSNAVKTSQQAQNHMLHKS